MGLVVKSTGSWHTVKHNELIIQCKIKGNYRVKDVKTTNPVAVGDIVDYITEDKKTGWITKIHPRKNYVIRKASKLSKEAHMLAANVDQAFLIVSLKLPATPPEFIDRFLVTAEAYHIKTIIVFNKVDLYDDNMLQKLNETVRMYSKIGYECLVTSVKTGENMETLKSKMKGKINVIAGNSGVGKSSIINSIDPKLDLKVAEVSTYHKSGKHSTTFSEMFELEDGGYIIDTPGIKGFGIIDFEKSEIGLFFPEIFRISLGCQYYNCSHTHEPNCKVKEAAESGEISYSRYRSYLNIFFDENEKYRKD
jgi:ribosome biogenesis GTPase / thiamine phosphate phosphatase